MRQLKLLIFKNKQMKRKSRFLIAIASAIITFGTLFATVGKPKYFDKHHVQMECNKESGPNNSNK